MIDENYLIDVKRQFRKIKKLGEKAIFQISDEKLFNESFRPNSIAIIMNPLSGNMHSRWTDFLITDGEKSNRNRDQEFVIENKSKKEIFEFWNAGWEILFETLESLQESDLEKKLQFVENLTRLLKRLIVSFLIIRIILVKLF